jgi:hypothetical protein
MDNLYEEIKVMQYENEQNRAISKSEALKSEQQTGGCQKIFTLIPPLFFQQGYPELKKPFSCPCVHAGRWSTRN